MIKNKIYYRSILELSIAGIIWGASFTVVRWALESFSASTLIFWRFILAFVVGEVLHFLFARNLYLKSNADIKSAILPGLFIGLSLFFQTYGLNYTTATNSGFITTMYVVLIPIISALFFKVKINLIQVLTSIIAFLGMALLLNLNSLNIAKGELITLLAAITAALQIIWVGKKATSTVSAFRFNNYQTFWALITILPFLTYDIKTLGIPLIPDSATDRSIISLLVLTFAVTLFAFYLQIKAQKVLSTTTASMLCLLEAPFSFIFATVLLSEKLTAVQFVGATVILLCCIFSIIYDRPKNRSS